MNKEDFEKQFLELLNILINMEEVYIPYFALPNDDVISIIIHLNSGRVECHKGSLKIYRFVTKREDKDHLKILAEYVYRHHDDNGLIKIINRLKVEVAKQI